MIDVQGNLKAQKNPSPTISRNFGLGVGMGRWGWAGGVWWRKRRTGHKGEEEGGFLKGHGEEERERENPSHQTCMAERY